MPIAIYDGKEYLMVIWRVDEIRVFDMGYQTNHHYVNETPTYTLDERWRTQFGTTCFQQVPERHGINM